jgi:deoxyribodipyrimidine photo-lyase
VDRFIFEEVKRYERERKISTKSTYWLVFEIIWRDFFRFFVTKHGRKVFFVGGAKGIRRSWSKEPERLRRWKEGLTGQPLVDANMRELKLTGQVASTMHPVLHSPLLSPPPPHEEIVSAQGG